MISECHVRYTIRIVYTLHVLNSAGSRDRWSTNEVLLKRKDIFSVRHILRRAHVTLDPLWQLVPAAKPFTLLSIYWSRLGYIFTERTCVMSVISSENKTDQWQLLCNTKLIKQFCFQVIMARKKIINPDTRKSRYGIQCIDIAKGKLGIGKGISILERG